MALLALGTITAKLADPTFTVVATNGQAAGTALATYTGFTVVWAPGLYIQIAGGAAGTGVITLVGVGAAPNVTFTLPATSQTVLYGPVPQEYANSSGLVQFNVTTVTNATAAGFLLPNVGQDSAISSGAKHNPFENNPSAADF